MPFVEQTSMLTCSKLLPQSVFPGHINNQIGFNRMPRKVKLLTGVTHRKSNTGISGVAHASIHRDIGYIVWQQRREFQGNLVQKAQ